MWKLTGVSSGNPTFEFGMGAFGIGLKDEDVRAIAESPNKVACLRLLEGYRVKAKFFMTNEVEFDDVDRARAAAGGEPFTPT